MKKAESIPPGGAIVPRSAACARVPQAGCGQAHASGRHVRWLTPKIPFFAPAVPMPKTTPAQPAAALPPTYEAALQELEQLVAQLESGQMPLDQLLAGYQRGAALLALCKDKLQAVEDQIKVLDGGQMKPWGGA